MCITGLYILCIPQLFLSRNQLQVYPVPIVSFLHLPQSLDSGNNRQQTIDIHIRLVTTIESNKSAYSCKVYTNTVRYIINYEYKTIYTDSSVTQPNAQHAGQVIRPATGGHGVQLHSHALLKPGKNSAGKCRVADPVHFRPDPANHNFKNRIRVRIRILLALTKNQFKHLNFFHIKHISFDI